MVVAFHYQTYRMDASALALVDNLLEDDPSDVDVMDVLVQVVVDILDKDLEHLDFAFVVVLVVLMLALVVDHEHLEVEHWMQMTLKTMIFHRYFHHLNCYLLIH